MRKEIEKDFETMRYSMSPSVRSEVADRLEGYIEQCADFQRAAEKERDALKAEVERLRAENSIYSVKDMVKLLEERDTLKAQVEGWTETARLYATNDADRQAERDALKARWTQLATDLDVHEDDLFESLKSNVRYSYMMREQRDRLEADRDYWQTEAVGIGNERDTLKAEVERLQTELEARPKDWANSQAKIAMGPPISSAETENLESERDTLKAEKEASQGMWGNMALGDAADKLYRAEQERDTLKADFKAEVERLRIIIDAADKNRREIGTRCRIAEQENTRLKAMLKRITDPDDTVILGRKPKEK